MRLMNCIEELEKNLDDLLIHPTNPYLYHEIGILLYQLGDLETSERYLQKAYELDPGDSDILYNYGSLLYSNLKLQKAKSVFEALMNLECNAIDVLEKLGDIYYQLGEYEMASKSLSSFNKLTGGEI